ncbi:Maf family protein [Alysiella filiformis]|uniref:dTTP/UTP pyrophosphatase n=1 Tax=Alysiella filiformis DSM 16848 TaxID=1120981 RepID=A0A286ES46_9NEIS|nr:Maf family protein [Alysiella filiformis]QMT31967.1 septum formation inhibitor Maf [Alysiella filiformis]UBQ57125.1 Maf family nucleotide pyrophosphatase [Alysiella filiformis DSM 16848]SOD73747.1 septum formation protein [Alysiella filiformis DSM 16848]
MNNILLASNSPRRREILTQLGYTVSVQAAEIDETPYPNETAHDYVLRMAIEKNQAAQQQFPPQNLPLMSADTTVALHNLILGKPESPQHAHQMLRQLSGSTHQVLTAVCVSLAGQMRHVVQENHVVFRDLSDDEITRYIATGEPLDKAGAYGIQGVGGVFVAHLSGSFTGVMGLPVCETMALLQQLGWQTPPFQAA